jgi:hypothetical protein
MTDGRQRKRFADQCVGPPPSQGDIMKVHVRHSLKTNVASAVKACTDVKSLEATYDELGGRDIRIKRDGRAPNARIEITRTMPANPPLAIRRFVPDTNDVSHTEAWRADDDGYVADIVVEIKRVPVKIKGTKALRPEKGGCTIEWDFEVTSGIPLVGGLLAAFGAEQLKANLESEYRILKSKL